MLYRLGKGISKRNIAVFADENFSKLESILLDCSLFSKNNIVQIHKDSIPNAGKEDIFLIHWGDFKDKIDAILPTIGKNTALIIYAPIETGRIDPENMTKIGNCRNSVVVNFKGRLLNDILTSLMTTSYER